MKYERLGDYCTLCGLVGHTKYGCRSPQNAIFSDRYKYSLKITVFSNLLPSPLVASSKPSYGGVSISSPILNTSMVVAFSKPFHVSLSSSSPTLNSFFHACILLATSSNNLVSQKPSFHQTLSSCDAKLSTSTSIPTEPLLSSTALIPSVNEMCNIFSLLPQEALSFNAQTIIPNSPGFVPNSLANPNLNIIHIFPSSVLASSQQLSQFPTSPVGPNTNWSSKTITVPINHLPSFGPIHSFIPSFQPISPHPSRKQSSLAFKKFKHKSCSLRPPKKPILFTHVDPRILDNEALPYSPTLFSTKRPLHEGVLSQRKRGLGLVTQLIEDSDMTDFISSNFTSVSPPM